MTGGRGDPGRDKWRPPQGLVLFGGLAGTLGLAFLGLVVLRLADPSVRFPYAALSIAAVIALATGVLALFLTRLILAPVRALAAQADALRRSGPAPRPRHLGTRELADLAGSVTAMADALVRREATVRAFADHAGHELKTPASTIRAAAELLAEGDLAPDDATLVASILDGCGRIEARLADLRRIATARLPAHHGAASLREVAARLSAPGLAVHATADADLPLGSEGLRIVLQELAANAAQHGATRLELRPMLEDGTPVLIVQDDGPGVSPGHAERVFDLFFTSRRAGGGTGMGLAIAASLLEAHGMSIALRPVPRGACFAIRFG